MRIGERVGYLKQLLSESAPKAVVLAGSHGHVNEAQLPFAALGTIFGMAPNGCTPEQLGEALVTAADALAEDTDTDSTVRFEQLVSFLEQATTTARALTRDAQPGCE